MPLRMAAARRVSPSWTAKVRPLGCTVTWWADAAGFMDGLSLGVRCGGGQRLPRRRAAAVAPQCMLVLESPDFALQPISPWRVAGALSAPAPADRRLRRHRTARGAAVGRRFP